MLRSRNKRATFKKGHGEINSEITISRSSSRQSKEPFLKPLFQEIFFMRESLKMKLKNIKMAHANFLQL